MVDRNHIENKVLVREFNEGRDAQVVRKLVKNCEIGSNKEVSIFTNMMGDLLHRIRLYPVHVMLVAELSENGELVGVVGGCIKCVGTRFGGSCFRMGCILGLRVSPTHRRMGIGLKLVKAVEEWLAQNGAHYIFLTTEKNNVASRTLFSFRCNYMKFCSLVVFVQPVTLPMKDQSEGIKIEKLQTDQAISLYNTKFKDKDIYPTDFEAILLEKLSLGTWVSYFKEEDEEWLMLHGDGKTKKEDIIKKTPSSWLMFSIWNSCEAYKVHIPNSRHHHDRHNHQPFKSLHATLTHARDKIFPCLKLPACGSLQKTFGFLFLYGLYGEGERLEELMKSIWSFALGLAENVKDCKVIITELGVSDPLINHVPRQQQSSMSCINDLWYLKKVNGLAGSIVDDEEQEVVMAEVGNVFVDPRDF